MITHRCVHGTTRALATQSPCAGLRRCTAHTHTTRLQYTKAAQRMHRALHPALCAHSKHSRVCQTACATRSTEPRSQSCASARRTQCNSPEQVRVRLCIRRCDSKGACVCVCVCVCACVFVCVCCRSCTSEQSTPDYNVSRFITKPRYELLTYVHTHTHIHVHSVELLPWTAQSTCYAGAAACSHLQHTAPTCTHAHAHSWSVLARVARRTSTTAVLLCSRCA